PSCYPTLDMTSKVERTAATTRTERTATIVRKVLSLKRRHVDGPASGTPQTFTVPRITMGRSRSCHVMVAHASVSTLHCELRVRGTHVELRDLDSANGTHLDG